MAEVGLAYVSVAPSLKGWGSRLNKEIGSPLDKAGRDGSKRFGDSFGRGMKTAFGAAGILGAGAATAIFKGSIDEASNLSESINAVQVSYGNASKGILALGKNSATAFGLSKSELNGYAVQFQSFSKTIAGSNGDVGKSFESIIGRATDFASVMNLEVGQAAELFQSGLAGETEPLRKYGIDLSAAAVEAFALSKGIVKNKKDLTEAAKVQARYGLLMQQTSKTQGDFKNTSGGLANQQRILQARMADLRAELGAEFIPVATKAVTFFNSKGIPALRDFGAEVKPVAEKYLPLAKDGLQTTLDVARPLADVVGGAAKAFDAMPGAAQKTLVLAGAALLLKNRVSGMLPPISSFDRSTALATTKTVGLKVGAVGAAAGLATLASSSNGASSGLGGLATIGASTAAGFAIGGPWGAAFGAAGGVLSIFTSRSDAAAASQARLKGATASVVATLNQQTGALTAASRAAAFKDLQDTGAVAVAKEMGISLADVADAAVGNRAAIDRVNAATARYQAAQSGSMGASLAAKAATELLSQSISGVRSNINGYRRGLVETNEALGKLDGKRVVAEIRVDGIGGALAGVATLGRRMDDLISKSGRVKVGNNAKGTDNWRGGLTWVGEKGPELLNLPKGSQVHTAQESKRIASMKPLASAGAGAARGSSADLETAVVWGVIKGLQNATWRSDDRGNMRLLNMGG